MESNDDRVTLAILNALNRIIAVDVALHSIMVDEADGVEGLESLQSHENDEIYKQSMRLLEKYVGRASNRQCVASRIRAKRAVIVLLANSLRKRQQVLKR